MVIFYKKWKKYNEFQLTKNKMDLNIRKMTNHPPSPVPRIGWVLDTPRGIGRTLGIGSYSRENRLVNTWYTLIMIRGRVAGCHFSIVQVHFVFC